MPMNVAVEKPFQSYRLLYSDTAMGAIRMPINRASPGRRNRKMMIPFLISIFFL